MALVTWNTESKVQEKNYMQSEENWQTITE